MQLVAHRNGQGEVLIPVEYRAQFLAAGYAFREPDEGLPHVSEPTPLHELTSARAKEAESATIQPPAEVRAPASSPSSRSSKRR